LEKRKTKRTDQRMWVEKDAFISQNDKRMIMTTTMMMMMNGLDCYVQYNSCCYHITTHYYHLSSSFSSQLYPCLSPLNCCGLFSYFVVAACCRCCCGYLLFCCYHHHLVRSFRTLMVRLLFGIIIISVLVVLFSYRTVSHLLFEPS